MLITYSPTKPMNNSSIAFRKNRPIIIGAKPADGWRFVKWTLNGEDFSNETLLHYTVKGNANFLAIFEFVE